MPRRAAQAGFTLIEILIAIGILTVLAALTVINLGQPQVTASLQGATETLVADLKGQQLQAMAGDNNGTASQQMHGLVVASNHYTLFAGASFDSGDTTNFDVTPGGAITFTSTLTDDQIQFAKGSGEVSGYDSGHNTITVHNGSDSKTVTINRLGTVTVQ